MEKTRKQHYVFQSYIKAWVPNNDKAVWCICNNKVCQMQPKNVGYKKDFYRLECPNDTERQIISALSTIYPPSGQKEIIKHIKDILNYFAFSDCAAALAAALCSVDASVDASTACKLKEQNIKKELDAGRNNIAEQFYGKSEGALMETFRKAFNNKPLFSDNKSKQELFLNICIQYFRTKAIRDDISKCIKEYINKSAIDKKAVSVKNVFNMLIWPAPGLLADNLLANNFNVHVVQNTTNIHLITSDQPVINLSADYSCCIEPKNLELYYPISPTMAIFIDKSDDRSNLNRPDYVNELNKKMITAASNFIITSSEKQAQDVCKSIANLKLSFNSHKFPQAQNRT